MPPSPPAILRPYVECSCNAKVDIKGKRVGDSIRCKVCNTLHVITRTNAKGDVPPAVRAGGLTPGEQKEVDDALRRIKLRRVGQASRHLQLYPSWVVLMALPQFWLSGVLAGHNITAQGDPRRGRRMQVVAVLCYLVVAGLILVGAFSFAQDMPLPVVIACLASPPLAFGAYYTWVQHAACVAARQAGAQRAPVLLPLLLGVILFITQAFAVWFLKLQAAPL